MLVGHLADLQGDEVVALGQQLRRTAGLGVVLQRHGEVRRVGDHHVGRRHRLHHPPLRHLALHLADLGLHFRLAFAVLVFVADFLLGHHQLLAVVPELIGNVHRGDQQQTRGQPQRAPAHHLGAMNDGLLQRFMGHRQQVVLVRLQHQQRHQQDHDELHQRLEQLQQRLGREHPLQSCQRIQPAELWRQRLAREQPAAQRDGADEGRHQQHGEDRPQPLGRQPAAGGEQLEHAVAVHHRLAGQLEAAAHQPQQAVAQRGAVQQQAAGASQ
ncbi:hypothetical protein D3C78_1053680 [compost metagenome]